jgi:ATP-binding cassette, subfamily G (WHITE), member 2, PDR
MEEGIPSHNSAERNPTQMVFHPTTAEMSRNTVYTPEIMAVRATQSVSTDNEFRLKKLAAEMQRIQEHHDATRAKRMPEPSLLAELVSGDPTLDPRHPNFDLYKWLGAVMDVAKAKNFKFRSLGFVFKDLTVMGSVTRTKVQETVLSSLFPYWLWSHFRNETPRNTILRKFNGFVNPGEMLLVLGRFGSGCSTLLKTIAGELRGLHIGEGSSINYSGRNPRSLI